MAAEHAAEIKCRVWTAEEEMKELTEEAKRVHEEVQTAVTLTRKAASAALDDFMIHAEDPASLADASRNQTMEDE